MGTIPLETPIVIDHSIFVIAILMFSSIGNDKDYGYYWMAFVVYAVVSNIILHKMEKKEKMEKE
ncbi:hypothetical protein AAEY33_26275 [Peribacillus simplex]|uniref:hypothetical protein n=1 Tax=Peribacillus simplex TaxID=1478 RepID=UPI0032662DA2